MTAVTLPRLSWGDPDSSKTALLVHGLGSSGALMWLLGDALANAGWRAIGIDLQAEHPTWHPQDLELKVDAVARGSRWAVEQTSVQIQPWDVRADAARLTIPTHIIGAGHSPHRDNPDDTVRHLMEALS